MLSIYCNGDWSLKFRRQGVELVIDGLSMWLKSVRMGNARSPCTRVPPSASENTVGLAGSGGWWVQRFLGGGERSGVIGGFLAAGCGDLRQPRCRRSDARLKR